MNKAEEVLRTYVDFEDVNGSEPITLLPLTIIDAMEEYATQCQEDTAELLKAEIRRAYIHGQGNAQGMAAGLERDEVEDYTNWRMLSLTKK